MVGVMPAATAIGANSIIVPRIVFPPLCQALTSAAQVLMSCPKPTSLMPSLFSATTMPRLAASWKDGPAATAEAKKCWHVVPSKLDVKLTLPGFSALTSSSIASCKHLEICLCFFLVAHWCIDFKWRKKGLLKLYKNYKH